MIFVDIIHNIYIFVTVCIAHGVEFRKGQNTGHISSVILVVLNMFVSFFLSLSFVA